MADQKRPHRPVRYADLTQLIDAVGGGDEVSRSELAAATAALVVQVGRGDDPAEGLIELADRIGLETLAALWRDAPPVSLPGALWALYCLRQWCHSNSDEVAHLWRLGEHVAAADAVVAGVGDYADIDAVRAVADAVLSGAYRGDFAVALERAAALFRVLASGRRERALSLEDAEPEIERAERNERVAHDLGLAAARWRAGTLP